MSGLSRTLRIKNRMGLHILPATEIVRIAYAYDADLMVLKYGHRASAKSVFSLIRLGIKCGDFIELAATGPDADQALHDLSRFLESYRDVALPTDTGKPPDLDSYAA